jgi:hypothetical protein
VCHWIASDGLAKFDQASILRKQKTVIRCLAKGIMSFWRSAEAVLTTGGRAKVMQKYDSDMPGETKPTGIEAEKEQVCETSPHKPFLTDCCVYVFMTSWMFPFYFFSISILKDIFGNCVK